MEKKVLVTEKDLQWVTYENDENNFTRCIYKNHISSERKGRKAAFEALWGDTDALCVYLEFTNYPDKPNFIANPKEMTVTAVWDDAEEEKDDEIKAGDVVQLKSGGPLMTAGLSIEGGRGRECHFFDGTGEADEMDVPEEALKKV